MPQYGKCVCAHTFFLSLLLDEMINSLHEVNYVPVWFQLKPAFSVFCFFFWFQLHYLTKSTVNSAFMHCLQTHKFHFSVTFSLKMGPMTLFTHLKIILL